MITNSIPNEKWAMVANFVPKLALILRAACPFQYQDGLKIDNAKNIIPISIKKILK